jgi:tRNA A-37 threonylcarbamoyl transferase component Bud32
VSKASSINSILITYLCVFSNELWDAFCTLHRLKILHGDVEPRNIILKCGCKPRIIDFSHAEVHDCPGPKECLELKMLWNMLNMH